MMPHPAANRCHGQRSASARPARVSSMVGNLSTRAEITAVLAARGRCRWKSYDQLSALRWIATSGAERVTVSLLAARAAEGTGDSDTAERLLVHEALTAQPNLPAALADAEEYARLAGRQRPSPCSERGLWPCLVAGAGFEPATSGL